MMKFGKPSSLMVFSSSCSCLFSQNSSVLLTKSCVRMCIRESEAESVCHCLCPQALHEHLSIPQYVRLEYENGQLFHHSSSMCAYGHRAHGECQNGVENPGSGSANLLNLRHTVATICTTSLELIRLVLFYIYWGLMCWNSDKILLKCKAGARMK